MVIISKFKFSVIFFIILLSFYATVIGFSAESDSVQKPDSLDSSAEIIPPDSTIFIDSVFVDSTLIDSAISTSPNIELFDSLQTSIVSDSTDSLKISVIPLREVQEKVRSLENSFYTIENKTFRTNSYFSRGNRFYTLPYQNDNYSIYNLKLNNFYLHNADLLDLLNYYNLRESRDTEEFYPIETEFLATLSALHFSKGSYNFEEKYVNFHKNKFANLFDLNFFMHSGKEQTPANDRYFFDALVIQIQKKFAEYKISYNFLKQFSNNNVFPASEFPPLKNDTYTNIFATSLLDSILTISYMNQIGKNILQEPDSTISNEFDYQRNQIAIGFFLPIPNYETDILLRADNNVYENQSTITDYYGLFKINSPGFFSNFYKMTIYNEVHHKTRPDTTYINPKLVFEILINENFSSNLSVGTRKENIQYLSAPGKIDLHLRENIFLDCQFEFSNHNINLELTSYINEIRNDMQYHASFEISEKYTIYGVNLAGEVDFSYLTLQNKIKCSCDLQKKPDEFVLRPDIRGKLFWNIQKSLGYHNFAFVKTQTSLMQNYRNSNFYEEPIQVFFDFEFGFKINEFTISAVFKNMTNQPYFMSPEMPINGISSSFKVHWNFIN
ncbi:MAG: hypothetical protein U9P79_02060 [Candidatus Cloacimonadota bacterium]|nr:hypothetical protein [Candidatus Cloacimonadota bacterium]